MMEMVQLDIKKERNFVDLMVEVENKRKAENGDWVIIFTMVNWCPYCLQQ